MEPVKNFTTVTTWSNQLHFVNILLYSLDMNYLQFIFFLSLKTATIANNYCDDTDLMFVSKSS